MRKYKFRVWKNHPNQLCMSYDEELLGDLYPFNDSKHYKFMQYTGIKDKNGKEIYEGDIVKYKTQFDKKKKCITVIQDVNLIDGFSEFHYDEYSNYNVNLDTIEVIGNIYENPELI